MAPPKMLLVGTDDALLLAADAPKRFVAGAANVVLLPKRLLNMYRYCMEDLM